MDLSAFDSAIRALDTAISRRDALLDWLIVGMFFFNVAVLVGLIVEFHEDAKQYFTGRPRTRRSWRLAFFGGIAVVLGILGELSVTLIAHHFETMNRRDSHKIEELLNAKSGSAADSADRANKSALQARSQTEEISKQADALKIRMEAASRELGELKHDFFIQSPRWSLLAKVAPKLTRQLALFSGQRVDMFVCGRLGSQDGETLSTWGTIATILGNDGAKWKLGHGGLVYFDRCSPSGGQPLGQGLMVFVSKGAPKDTIDAANALGEGLASALPPSRDKMPGIIDPDFSERFLQPIEGKDTPWAMVANDPHLITVLVGAHPQQ